MTYVLLVGKDVALLEGLSQSLATLGHTPRVAHDLSEARQIASAQPPLVLVADRALASSSGAELLGTPLSAGGARILYRLAALVQSVAERARLAGRSPKHTPPESRTV